MNRIAGEPELRPDRHPCDVKSGTVVTMHWPEVASYLTGGKGHEFYNAGRFLNAYATFNPHAAFELQSNGEIVSRVEPENPGWKKWFPWRPTSSRWYCTESLRDLIAAHIAAERRGERALSVREFISQFHGMSASARQRDV